MKINGMVHCFFEQSGTFKKAFREMGIGAADYDVQNDFGETDFQIDLFDQINTAYFGGGSIFDDMSSDDLIIAFFPCIYFCDARQMMFQGKHYSQRDWSLSKIMNENIRLESQRSYYFTCLLQLVEICSTLDIPLIIENPWNTNGGTYLQNNFIRPSLIDRNRTIRGDYYAKPTAYWFIGCEPTTNESRQSNANAAKVTKVKGRKTHGGGYDERRTEQRSMISPEYARNFIADFVIGRETEHTIPTLKFE